MGDYETIFQLFALLLGLSIAELLMGLARAWHIKAGATGTGGTDIQVGWLVPLFGLLLICDLTKFWIMANSMRDHLTLDYATMLAMVVIVGGYYVISTFVFPDEPGEWPDFDNYFLRTNRVVVGGMILVNVTIMLYAASLVAGGAPWENVPVARSRISMGVAALYLPSLIALWFAKSKRTNLIWLLIVNVLLLTLAMTSSNLGG